MRQVLRILVKPLQKPIDHGIVTCICNPADVDSVFKPCIIIFADEHPIGESMELAVIYDKYLDIRYPSLLTMEVDVFQARLANREEATAIMEYLGARKYYISPWNIIDLYMPSMIIESVSLDKTLQKLASINRSDNPYIQGIVNYLRRVGDGINRLLNLKISIEASVG